MRPRIVWATAVMMGLALLGTPRIADAFRLNPWWRNFEIEPPDIAPDEPPRHGGNAQMCHWDLRQFTDCRVPWSMGRFSADMPATQQLDAIVAAFKSWEDVQPARIGFRLTASGGGSPGVADRYNKVGWVDSLSKGVVALTCYWADRGSGRLVEADILFNDDYTWIADPPEGSHYLPNQFGVKHVATHEIGHFIGLGHTELEGPDLDYFPVGDFPHGSDYDDNGDGIYNRYIMNRDDGYARTLVLEDDRDGCNFLYNVDLGDAPDPYHGVFNHYPSLVHGAPSPITLNGIPLLQQARGAEHLLGIRPRQRDRNYTYEWLGYPFSGTDDVDGECEANVPNLDKFDDGVVFTPNPPICGKPFELRSWVRYATDFLGRHHWYADSDSGGPLIARTWVDFNRDALWDPSEIVLHDRISPAELPNLANVTQITSATGYATLPIVDGDPPWYWVRARLDWVEDDSPNWDGTLNGPEGAAYFGEVEDYPVRCENPYRQGIYRNDSGAPAQALAVVLPGNGSLGEHFEAFVDGGDCTTSSFQGTTTVSFDAGANETTVVFSDPRTIAPGQRVHVGLGPSSGLSTQVLRANWMPVVGTVGASSQLPITNALVIPGLDEAGAVVAHVIVGTVNDAVGGVLVGNPATATWQDSIFVDVTARLAPTSYSLPALSLCNPALVQLSAVPLGARWITPDRPLDAVLPADLSGKNLVLEVRSSWSRNPATGLEILEYEHPVDATTSVAPARESTRNTSLNLSVAPNPAAHLLFTRFFLATPQRVTLRVFDVRGSRVRTLLDDEWAPAGNSIRIWDGRDELGRRMPAGAYFVRVETGGTAESKAIVLLH